MNKTTDEILNDVSVKYYIKDRGQQRFLFVEITPKVHEAITKLLRKKGWKFQGVTTDEELYWSDDE